MSQPTPEVQVSENELIALRQQKLADIRTQGQAFPNDFRRENYAQNLQTQFADNSKEELEAGERTIRFHRWSGHAQTCHG